MSGGDDIGVEGIAVRPGNTFGFMQRCFAFANAAGLDPLDAAKSVGIAKGVPAKTVSLVRIVGDVSEEEKAWIKKIIETDLRGVPTALGCASAMPVVLARECDAKFKDFHWTVFATQTGGESVCVCMSSAFVASLDFQVKDSIGEILKIVLYKTPRATVSDLPKEAKKEITKKMRGKKEKKDETLKKTKKMNKK